MQLKVCPRCHRASDNDGVVCTKCASVVKEFCNNRKANGICVSCSNPAELGKTRCISHLKTARTTRRQRVADGLCGRCSNSRLPNDTLCAECRKRMRSEQHLKRRRDKIATMSHYGGLICACCGEKAIEFLTIDHVNNDGAEHRKTVHPTKLYVWLRRNNYPLGFQVLCINCNLAKGLYGECPHKKRICEPFVFIA